MHRPPARFLMFAAVMAVTLSGGVCAPLSKDEPAPVIPHYDAADQPFRMAPMPQSTRSIVVSLATNLHLAFDTALLRTHTVWSGRGLALLGPQFGLPKAPFISTNDTTVLWGMPPVFPWAAGGPPEKDAETLLPGARFIAVKSSPTRFEYELATGGERPALIQEMPDSFSGAINGLHRHLTVQSNRSELWFLAHAEMGRGESLSPQAAVLERADTALLVSVRGRLDLKLQLQERNASYSVETVTEQGAVKGNPRQTISGKEVRAWVQIPPTQPGDIQGIQITTEVFRSKRDAVEWFQLSAARAKVSVCFARTNSGGPPVFSSAGLRPSAASTSSYRAEAFPLPKEIELSVCGMDFLPNGDLVVCTWPGEVFIVEKATGPVKGARYRRFARGLCEPLGVAVRAGKIYVGTKPGLYRLTDTDGNGEADLFECVSQGWGYSGHYNSFSYGPVLDQAGNFILANAGHGGRWDSPYSGWAFRISPDGGKLGVICSGLREPNGIGTFGPGRDVFVSENQGEWMPACKLNHVTPGKFYGHPSAWPAKQEEYGRHTRFDPPAVWFPYKLARSVTGFAEITDDRFGPFKGQLMVGDFQNAIVTRVQLEKVNGEYQGAVWPFLRQLLSGVNRLAYGADGRLYVGGLQAPRTWPAVAPLSAALERVEFTGRVPFEVKEVHVQRDGFELTFTQPVEAKSAADPEAYDVLQHGFKYHAKYGSPELDHNGRENSASVVRVTVATVSPDRLKVRLTLAGWKTGYVTMVRSLDVKNGAGEPLVNDTFWYTLNELPK